MGAGCLLLASAVERGIPQQPASRLVGAAARSQPGAAAGRSERPAGAAHLLPRSLRPAPSPAAAGFAFVAACCLSPACRSSLSADEAQRTRAGVLNRASTPRQGFTVHARRRSDHQSTLEPVVAVVW